MGTVGSMDDERVAELIADLTQRGLTLATAESLTGGGLVARGGVPSRGVSSVSLVAGGFGRMAAGRAKGDHERRGLGGVRAGSAGVGQQRIRTA